MLYKSFPMNMFFRATSHLLLNSSLSGSFMQKSEGVFVVKYSWDNLSEESRNKLNFELIFLLSFTFGILCAPVQSDSGDYWLVILYMETYKRYRRGASGILIRYVLFYSRLIAKKRI